MQEQKRYHKRKLSIIKMIKECDKRIKREKYFLERLTGYDFDKVVNNSCKNIDRYERLKRRLIKWLNQTTELKTI